MRPKMIMGLLLLVWGCAALIQPPRVAACSCIADKNAEAARDSATAVFVGKVTSMQPPFDQITDKRSIQFFFKVDRVWKGPVKPSMMLTVNVFGGCGYPFEDDQEYLVYADGTEPELSASFCSRTQPLADSEAQADLLVLGAGAVPPPEQSNLWSMVIAVAVVIISAGAVWLTWIRRKPS